MPKTFVHPAFPLALLPRQGIAVARRAERQGKEAEGDRGGQGVQVEVVVKVQSTGSCTGCHSLAADYTKELFSFFALPAHIEVHCNSQMAPTYHTPGLCAHFSTSPCNLVYPNALLSRLLLFPCCHSSHRSFPCPSWTVIRDPLCCSPGTLRSFQRIRTAFG